MFAGKFIISRCNDQWFILMKARVRNFTLDASPMTKYDYNQQILKVKAQHTENKWIDGFFCNWNGHKFWIDVKTFNKLYTIEDDNEI